METQEFLYLTLTGQTIKVNTRCHMMLKLVWSDLILKKTYLESLYFHVIIERRASIFEAQEERGKKAVRICKYL